ncbi:hypothetical protein [Erythrobacter donghaensis]|uniref:hypothetical protein n=1 Tax=Erythrobacter donghaensis TaxID=267135 RepID=UPI000A3975DA|nr:hypothetical protein [Erythrobacter donghaensis]
MKNVVLLACTAFMLVACNETRSPPDPRPSDDSSASDRMETAGSLNSSAKADVFIARYQSDPGMPEALLTGSLEISDGCLVFNAGGVPSLALLPPAARMDAEANEIVIGTERVPLGREMQWGGGNVPADSPMLAKLVSTPPPQCPKDATIVGEVQ